MPEWIHPEQARGFVLSECLNWLLRTIDHLKYLVLSLNKWNEGERVVKM